MTVFETIELGLLIEAEHREVVKRARGAWVSASRQGKPLPPKVGCGRDLAARQLGFTSVTKYEHARRVVKAIKADPAQYQDLVEILEQQPHGIEHAHTELLRRLGVTLKGRHQPRHAILRRARRSRPTTMLERALTGIAGYVAAFDDIDFTQLDLTQREQWIRLINASLKALQQVKKGLTDGPDQ